MNLHSLALKRAKEAGPIGVALIGAGKFGSSTQPLALRRVAEE